MAIYKIKLLKGYGEIVSVQNIITERLILIPFTYKIAKSLLEGKFEALDDIGLNISSCWPDIETIEILPKIIKNLESVDEPTGFGSWIIVKKDGMYGIGDAGYKAKPNEKGEVDLGYSLTESERRKGYATEIAIALTNWAFSKAEVKSITASCALTNIPSARVLEKLGMHKVSQDNEMIYWRIENNY